MALTHTITPGAATRGFSRYRKEVQALCGRWVLDTVSDNDAAPTCPDCKAQADDDADVSAALDALVERQQAEAFARFQARVQQALPLQHDTRGRR